MLINKNALQALMRALALPLMGEGVAMLLCVPASLHFADGTAWAMAACGLFVALVGLLLRISAPPLRQQPKPRVSYLIVVLLWLLMTLGASLPFLATGAFHSLSSSFFEATSALTSTGATAAQEVEALPASIILWRSVAQWIGGYGIVVLVLAVVPSLGINKYSLYTAEVSGADNTGKSVTSMAGTIRQTMAAYAVLTLFFVIVLIAMGMQPWDATNLVFCNISTGGFSPYGDGIARFSAAQQYVLAGAMLCGGMNFMMLHNLFTLRFRLLRGKLDQLGTYLSLTLLVAVGVFAALRWRMGYAWPEAARLAVVHTVSAATTTGSLSADTSLWWPPVQLLFLALGLCGGMAGSTSGGLKTMRVLILLRNVRAILRGRLHPHAVNPVRLNGSPVPERLVNNVMVIFLFFVFSLLACTIVLSLLGVPVHEALGAAVGCVSGYGPGLGRCGGFGSYAFMSPTALWTLSATMLLGRLEFMAVIVLFLPSFWRK